MQPFQLGTMASPCTVRFGVSQFDEKSPKCIKVQLNDKDAAKFRQWETEYGVELLKDSKSFGPLLKIKLAPNLILEDGKTFAHNDQVLLYVFPFEYMMNGQRGISFTCSNAKLVQQKITWV